MHKIDLFKKLLDIKFPPCSGIGLYDNAQLEKIWKYLYSMEGVPENTEIKIKKTEDNCTLILVREGVGYFTQVSILQNPITFNISDSIKELKIYTKEQSQKILNHLLISGFSIKVNGQLKNYEDINYKDINKVEIVETNIVLKEFENFKNYIFKNNSELLFQKEEIITLEKSKLSFYFDKITLSNESEKKFKLIIDRNRIRLINSIEEFFSSDNSFYLIMGTDGVGKTIGILSFSSYLHDYKILYLNLKLFFREKTKENIEEIFFNELKRIFFAEDEDNIKSNYETYEKMKQYIKTKIKDNSKEGMEFAWSLLFAFLDSITEIYFNLETFLIILDQYNVDKIDKNYTNLDNLADIINKKFKVFYKTKLLIVVSIND